MRAHSSLKPQLLPSPQQETLIANSLIQRDLHLVTDPYPRLQLPTGKSLSYSRHKENYYQTLDNLCAKYTALGTSEQQCMKTPHFTQTDENFDELNLPKRRDTSQRKQMKASNERVDAFKSCP